MKNDLGNVDMIGAKQLTGLRGFVAALALLCSAAAAGAVELEIGKTYEGGERVEAKTYGLSFTVPEGWSGLLPPGGTFFAMTPDNRTFVFATAEPGSAEDAQGSLSQPYRSATVSSCSRSGDLAWRVRGCHRLQRARRLRTAW